MTSAANVVRPSRWFRAEELEIELTRSAAAAEPVPAIPEEVDVIAPPPSSIDEDGYAEEPPVEVPANTRILIPFWHLIISSAMVGAFVIRGAIGFAGDMIGR